jgi:hypothetical protein
MGWLPWQKKKKKNLWFLALEPSPMAKPSKKYLKDLPMRSGLTIPIGYEGGSATPKIQGPKTIYI